MRSVDFVSSLPFKELVSVSGAGASSSSSIESRQSHSVVFAKMLKEDPLKTRPRVNIGVKRVEMNGVVRF